MKMNSLKNVYSLQGSQGCLSAIKGLFGSDSSKSTKFGPEVKNAIWFTFLPGPKTGADVNHT